MVPGNRDGSPPPGAGAEVDVRDGVAPRFFGMFNLGPPNYIQSSGDAFAPIKDRAFDNRDKNTEYIASILLDFEHISSVLPMEPLDTTIIPAIEIVENPGAPHMWPWDSTYHPEPLSFTWISGKAAVIKVRVAAGKTGFYDKLFVSLGDLRDLSGNGLMGNPGQQYPKSQTPLIRLYHELGSPYEYD